MKIAGADCSKLRYSTGPAAAVEWPRKCSAARQRKSRSSWPLALQFLETPSVAITEASGGSSRDAGRRASGALYFPALRWTHGVSQVLHRCS